MNYINLKEDLRVGYEVKASYYENELIRDMIDFDEILKDNLYICGVSINGLLEVEDMYDSLTEYVSMLDIVKHSTLNSDYVLESLPEELLYEDEWLELVGERDIKEIKRDLFSGKLKELEKLLGDLKISEFYHAREIVGDLVEEDKINLVLENMKVIKGEWRGYSQGDYAEYYTVIQYHTKEEKKELEDEVLEKFNYLDLLLNGDVFDINIGLEERKLFREVGGELEKNIWIVKNVENFSCIVLDYADLKNEVKLYLEYLVPREYHKQIEKEIIEFMVEY